MRVLILYPYNKQQLSLMESTCKQLNNYGIYTNRLEYPTYKFYSPNGDRAPLCCFIYHFFMHIPKLRALTMRHFEKNIIKYYSNIVKDYDILDLQSSFRKDFAKIAENAQKSNIKVKTQIWGSDLNWETKEQRPWKDKIYKYSNIIQLGPSINGEKKLFEVKYPEYISKVRRAPFGRFQFDILDSLFVNQSLIDDSFLSKQAIGKLMITCGYNGREMQQHVLILDAIDKLPMEIKKQLFLFLPMTYLLKDDYFSQVSNKLQKMGIPYQIQRTRLTLMQNLTMRMKTDIVVNIQKTDGLAASLQEHLYCGNVLIAGDWLPYNVFTYNGVFYIKSSLNDLLYNFKDAVEHYSLYKKKCIDNKNKLYKITSWKAVLPQWREIYEEMLRL